jgi:hypothetical protein
VRVGVVILPQQFLIGGDDLHVGNNDVRLMERAVLRDDAGDTPVLLAHFGDLAVEAHFDAEFVHQALEADSVTTGQEQSVFADLIC